MHTRTQREEPRPVLQPAATPTPRALPRLRPGAAAAAAPADGPDDFHLCVYMGMGSRICYVDSTVGEMISL